MTLLTPKIFWQNHRSRLLAWTLISICGVMLFLRYPHQAVKPGAKLPSDFETYFHAWQRISQGLSPYAVVDSGLAYRYSPGALTVFKLLPHHLADAWWVFSLTSIVSLCISLAVGARYRDLKSVGLLLLGLGLSWKGILEALDTGQLEVFLFAVTMLAAASLRRVPILAGLLCGFLPAFKLPWVLFVVPFLVMNRQEGRRSGQFFSGYFMSWFVWGAALPSITFGSERATLLTREWLQTLSLQRQALVMSDMNQSIWIAFERWIGAFYVGGFKLKEIHVLMAGPYPVSLAKSLALGFSLLVVGWVFGSLMTRLKGLSTRQELLVWLSPWALLIQLMSPISWRWGSVLAIGMPFAIASVSSLRGRTWHWMLIGMVFGLWMIQQNPLAELFGFKHWTDLHPYGSIAAFWLAVLWASLPARPSPKNSA